LEPHGGGEPWQGCVLGLTERDPSTTLRMTNGERIISTKWDCYIPDFQPKQSTKLSMKNYIIIILTLLAFCLNVGAQEKIKGRVVDAQSHEPLAGATIKVLQPAQTVMSNTEGYFELTLAKGNYQLSVQYLGYVTKEQSLAIPLTATLLIHLTSKENTLQEVNVVSTGYQTLPKERATGSFTVIDNKTLERTVSSDFLSRLKGVSNGLLFDNSVGNATGISVRGRSTIFSNTTPLIVIDNFPFEGDLNTINPDIIETITLLKDAAAASIWGVRAGNGVIVITTKNGKLNTEPKISLNANLTVAAKPDLFYQPQLTSSEYIDVEQFLFDKGAYTATINNGYATISPVVAILQKIKLNPAYASQGKAEIDALREIDNRTQLSKYFYRNSSVQHYAADVTGGGKNQSYYFAAGYDQNLTDQVAQGNDRITLKGTNSYRLLQDKLRLNTDISFSKSSTSNTYTGGYSPFLPYEQLADANGNPLATLTRGGLRQSYVESLANTSLLDWSYRPLAELRNQGSTQTTQLTDYRLGLGLSYQLHPSLSFALNYQYYNANTKVENLNDKDSFYTRNLVNTYTSINQTSGVVTRPIPYGGIYNPSFVTRQSNYGRAQLNFNRAFGGHQINAIAGYELRDDQSKQNAYTVYGYRPETGSSALVDLINPFPYYYNQALSGRIAAYVNQGASINRYISWYANSSYSYHDKYIVSASYRKDESNLFGVRANQKGVPLWSAGLAWNLHKENFIKFNWLSNLQLKATYGYNGNVNNSISAYLTASSSTYNLYGVQGFAIVNPPNDNLRWERVKNANVGLYFTTKASRINGSIEYYIKQGMDLIASSAIAPQTGISLFTGNTANTRAAGIDVQLNGKIIDGAFQWNTTLIFNHVKDKITAYKGTIGANSSIVTANTNNLSPMLGYPINPIFGYPWAGLSANGSPQGYLNGVVSIDYAAINNSKDRAQLQFLGSATPKVFGSVRNTFAFKNIELSFNLSYKLGYYFRKRSLSNASLFSGTYEQRDYGKRWQKPGDEWLTHVPALIYPNVANRSDFYNYSAVLVDRGDQVRLQDIQLNYTLLKKPGNKLPFSGINIYAYASNLGLVWKMNKQGIDPDFRTGYPNPRSLALGLKTNF